MMATKAERFKVEMERAAQRRKAAGGGAKGKTRAKAANRRSRRQDLTATHATRNDARARGKKSSYALEVVGSTRPSRKSTRKSRNRQKTDSVLRNTEMKRNASPKARAARPTGNPN
jgi:hypothetical protein